MKFLKLISILGLALSGLASAVVTVGSQGQGIQPGDRTPFLNALGGTSAGKALFQMANPSAVRYIRLNADNTVSQLDAASFLTAIGGGAGGVTSINGNTGAITGIATLTGTETLTNKTFIGPVLGNAVATTLNGAAFSGGAGSYLTLGSGADISLGPNSHLATVGPYYLDLTTTANSSPTFPAGTATLASLAGAEALTNKSVNGVTLAGSGTLTTTGGTLGTAAFTATTAYDAAGLATTAQANAVQRANHTGTQTLDTLSQSGATAGQAAVWSGSAWAPSTVGSNLTSGPVTSSAGVSAIADSALTMAKTSGLQTALNLKQPVGTFFYDIANYASGNQLNGTADATAAVQSALTDIETAMKTSSGGRFTLWLGDAVLRIDGALQTTDGFNSQLKLPAIDIFAVPQCTLTIKGATPQVLGMSVIGALPIPTKGAIIRSTLATGGGTRPSLISGKAPASSSWLFTNVNLHLENVIFQTVDNPLITAVDCKFVPVLDMENCAVMGGQNLNVDSAVYPTTSTSTAIIGPTINNGAYTRFKAVGVMGFYNGYELNEHTEGSIYAMGCRNAVIATAANHGSSLTRLLVQHCNTNIKSSGGPSFWQIDSMTIEHSNVGGDHFLTAYDIDDPSNYLKGSVKYAVVLGNVGPDPTFVKNGAANFECSAMGDNVLPIWSSLSGTTPALTFTNTPKALPLTLSGNTTFTASGYSQGRKMTLYINGDGTTRTLTWPGWTWLGTAPTTIAGTGSIQVDLTCTGTGPSTVFARFSTGTSAALVNVADNFNRANNSSLIGDSTSGHTPEVLQGTWGILSNRAYLSSGTTVGGDSTNSVVWPLGSGDATVQVSIYTPPSGAFSPGITMRAADNNNFLLASIGDGGNLVLYKKVAGTATLLATVTAQGYTNSQTIVLKAVTSGSTVQVYVDNVLKITYSTSTGLETNGKHGVNYYSGAGASAAIFDDLSITTP